MRQPARTCNSRLAVFMALAVAMIQSSATAQARTKTERFDDGPAWEGINNRSAARLPPVSVRQDFGFSNTSHAGGAPGEIGGYLFGAGEAAYYGKVIPAKGFGDRLTASGTIAVDDGPTHFLLGFFNADTAKEWRTANTIALRINGRGDYFYAYVEYCTRKWRTGADNPRPFERPSDKFRTQFAGGGKVHQWSLTYDPAANNGAGAITATIDDQTAICSIDPGHKRDGAVFNRFGLLTVMKSADGGTNVYLDNLTINGQPETFDQDPGWEGKNNRATYQARIVRPRFDFGYSPSNHAGGAAPGELGGTIFRGDCRYPGLMACYGDKLPAPLKLDRPLHASGRIALTRGVSDSTVFFGFYNSADSMRVNESQKNGIPESVLGIHIEGPSREGFLVYPVYRMKGADGRSSGYAGFPHILPDGAPHDWAIDYDPAGPSGRGRIILRFDGEPHIFDLPDDLRSSPTAFDRLGIVTSWIDGNSQDIWFDDLTYTVEQ